jgi:hypothetical protein
VADDDEHTGFAEIDIFGHQRSDLFGSSDLIGYFWLTLSGLHVCSIFESRSDAAQAM